MEKPKEYLSIRIESEFKDKIVDRCEELGGLTITRYIFNLVNKDLEESAKENK